MLNFEVEQNFIKKFIDKRLRDRMIMELNHEHDIVKQKGKEYFYPNKYRHKAIQRFSSISKIILPSYIYLEDQYVSEEEVEKVIRGLGKLYDKAHMICDDPADGEEFSLHDGIAVLYNNYGTSILICGENVALVKVEASYGTPMKYILYRKP